VMLFSKRVHKLQHRSRLRLRRLPDDALFAYRSFSQECSLAKCISSDVKPHFDEVQSLLVCMQYRPTYIHTYIHIASASADDDVVDVDVDVQMSKLTHKKTP